MTRVICDSGIRKGFRAVHSLNHKTQSLMCRIRLEPWHTETVIGSLRNHDEDESHNVKKKTVGLTKKTAVLYAHHAFKVHFFGVQLHHYDTTWSLLMQRFIQDVNRRRWIFLSLRTWIQFRKIAYISWQIWRVQIDAAKCERMQIHIFSNVFTVVVA